MTNLGLSALAALFLGLLGSCAQMQVASAKKELESRLNPLLGQTSDDVLLAVGAPQRTRQFGEYEVWEYYRSYGTRSNYGSYNSLNGNVDTYGTSYSNSFTANTAFNANGSGYGQGRTWETYDQFSLYFDANKVLVKWDGYVQR